MNNVLITLRVMSTLENPTLIDSPVLSKSYNFFVQMSDRLVLPAQTGFNRYSSIKIGLNTDPRPLAGQVKKFCERSDSCENTPDPCQLAWQVNKSCERSGVSTAFSGLRSPLPQNSFTCQASWQGSGRFGMSSIR